MGEAGGGTAGRHPSRSLGKTRAEARLCHLKEGQQGRMRERRKEEIGQRK